MQVTINGKLEEVQADTVLEVLTYKEVDPHMVAVELNTQIVERDQLETTPLTVSYTHLTLPTILLV